jgi:alpha-tubulin suppressor-like RCC1 family protein
MSANDLEPLRKKKKRSKLSKFGKYLTKNLPPANPKYIFEPSPKDYTEYDVSNHGVLISDVNASTVLNNLLTSERDTEGRKQRPPLYPVGWGWNAGRRAGNLTEFEIFYPKQVQKSVQHNYIASATGANHSLIVSDNGAVFSFGEGRCGQLGYGNQFTNEHPKGGIIQAFPRAVAPSGEYNKGCDIKVTQVACGATFSLARQLCPDEGVALRRGLQQMTKALSSLLNTYGEAEILQRALSSVKQEHFDASVKSKGIVTAWGMGNNGELGLGKYITFSPSPLAIPRFKNMRIIQIAAGPEHVLAINSSKQLYSWGKGGSGRLGLSDFNDRHTPEYVSFYRLFNVEYCAAGDAHSAVLITNLSTKSSSLSSIQLKRISTFGRGYHGRLGNGTNRNTCTPVAITNWLPSMQGLNIRQVVYVYICICMYTYTYV